MHMNNSDYVAAAVVVIDEWHKEEWILGEYSIPL